MDHQLASFYVTLVAALTGRIRPIWRYPIVFMITLVIFLLGSLVTKCFRSGREKGLESVRLLLTTESGLLFTVGIGIVGVLCVWVAFLFDLSEEEIAKAAKNELKRPS